MTETTELECGVCGNTTSSFFIVIGLNTICKLCKSNKKEKEIPKFQRPRTFTRWLCATHNCGTYSINLMMFKHLMKDCDIKQQETLGIVRPATYGGHNGDISRKFFLGINEMARLETNLANYKRFVMIKYKLGNKKFSYANNKYYNKHLRFLDIPDEPLFHRLDEMFRKIKFNLDLYIEGLPKRVYIPSMSQADRSKLYYKNLMSNFQMQVVAK